MTINTDANLELNKIDDLSRSAPNSGVLCQAALGRKGFVGVGFGVIPGAILRADSRLGAQGFLRSTAASRRNCVAIPVSQKLSKDNGDEAKE